MDLGAWASGARRTFPLSFFCDDVFGLGHLRLVLQVIFLSKSSDKNSPKTHFYASLLQVERLLPYFHFYPAVLLESMFGSEVFVI